MDCLLLKYNHVSSYYPLLPNESKSLIIIKSFVDNYAHTYRLLSLLFPLINYYRCTAYIKPTRHAFVFKTRIIIILFKIDLVWIRYALQINWTHCFQYFICNPNTLWHLLIKHWCYLYFLWPLICLYLCEPLYYVLDSQISYKSPSCRHHDVQQLSAGPLMPWRSHHGHSIYTLSKQGSVHILIGSAPCLDGGCVMPEQ